MGNQHDKMVDEELEEEYGSFTTITKNRAVEMLVEHDKEIIDLRARVAYTQLWIVILFIVVIVMTITVIVGGYATN